MLTACPACQRVRPMAAPCCTAWARRVAERAAILRLSGARCPCGTIPGPDAAHDPRWYIDAVLAHGPGATVVRQPDVRCPACW